MHCQVKYSLFQFVGSCGTLSVKLWGVVGANSLLVRLLSQKVLKRENFLPFTVLGQSVLLKKGTCF